VLEFLPEAWRDLAIPIAVFFAVFGVAWIVRRVAFARLHGWAVRTSTTVDETLLESLRGPTLLWIVILAIYVATAMSRLPRTWASLSESALLVLWIVSLTLAGSRLAARLVRAFLHLGTLAEVLASVLVGLLGGVGVLRVLGLDITPVLTAFGVGGLAVALALQDTLSNLFAGIYVSMSSQIRVGDFVQLENGLKGRVSDIGWRTTTLRESANNLVIIPNNKLSQSVLTNFHLPEARLAVQIPVSVAQDSDLRKVEAVLLDIVASSAVPGLLAEPKPKVLLLPGFGERSLDYTLICHVREYEDQFMVQHEVRKAIVERFRAEGIVIPRAPSA
jgi:small-conductance mechanosensitive channel